MASSLCQTGNTQAKTVWMVIRRIKVIIFSHIIADFPHTELPHTQMTHLNNKVAALDAKMK